MSKKKDAINFHDDLAGRDLLEYGAVFSRELVWELLGIEVPEQGTMKQFAEIQLKELTAIDYVRNILLGQGKYLAGTQTGYRVLLPSENRGQIDSYISSADRKLNRALKLSRSTPREKKDADCQMEARIMLKKEGARSRFASQ